MADLSPVESFAITNSCPHVMINSGGDLFYPDNPEDAAWFRDEHDAYPLHPDQFPWRELTDD